jgi:hypothetical protein
MAQKMDDRSYERWRRKPCSSGAVLGLVQRSWRFSPCSATAANAPSDDVGAACYDNDQLLIVL